MALLLWVAGILAFVSNNTELGWAIWAGAERPEPGIMQQPPRKKQLALLNRSLMLRAYCVLGLIEGLLGMAGFFFVWLANGYHLTALQAQTAAILARSADATTMAIYHQATTVMLAIIVACQDGNVFACRSERIPVWRINFFSNPLIWVGIAVEWILILSVIYLPALQTIFSTAALQPVHWLMLLTCPPIMLLVDSLYKRLQFRHSVTQK